jgi:hypothetical protein
MFTFFIFALAAPHIGYAAVFTVNSTVNTGDASRGDGFCDTGRKVPPPSPPSSPATPECTLRAAIDESNALPGKDVINLPGGVYVTGNLRILGDLSLIGDITDRPIIRSSAVLNRDNQGNVISITGGSGIFFIGTRPKDPGVALVIVDISNATIQNGTGFPLGFPTEMGTGGIPGIQGTGGAIVNNEGNTLVLERVEVSNNFAVQGGGIANLGHLILRRSTVSGNFAGGVGVNSNGGGGITNGQLDILTDIRSSSTLIEESTISGNTASMQGGGITNSAKLDIKNSTISGNVVTGERTNSPRGGGGISHQSGQLVLNNVTIAKNSTSGSTTGRSSTGGGVLQVGSGSFSFANTIIADNSGPSAGTDCSGTLISAGFNLIERTQGCIIGGDTIGNILPGQDPQLGNLALDSRSLTGTVTHEPRAGSPVINAGNPAEPGSLVGNACEAGDQRGLTRRRCDIGAFEVGAPEIIIPGIPPSSPTGLGVSH